jgi:hypothetical protein
MQHDNDNDNDPAHSLAQRLARSSDEQLDYIAIGATLRRAYGAFVMGRKVLVSHVAMVGHDWGTDATHTHICVEALVNAGWLKLVTLRGGLGIGVTLPLRHGLGDEAFEAVARDRIHSWPAGDRPEPGPEVHMVTDITKAGGMAVDYVLTVGPLERVRLRVFHEGSLSVFVDGLAVAIKGGAAFDDAGGMAGMLELAKQGTGCVVEMPRAGEKTRTEIDARTHALLWELLRALGHAAFDEHEGSTMACEVAGIGSVYLCEADGAHWLDVEVSAEAWDRPPSTAAAVIEQLPEHGRHYLLTGEIRGSFPDNGRQQCSRLHLIDHEGHRLGCETTPLGFAVRAELKRRDAAK